MMKRQKKVNAVVPCLPSRRERERICSSTRDMCVADFFLEKLESGLFTLQLTDAMIGRLVALANKDLNHHIRKQFALQVGFMMEKVTVQCTET